MGGQEIAVLPYFGWFQGVGFTGIYYVKGGKTGPDPPFGLPMTSFSLYYWLTPRPPLNSALIDLTFELFIGFS